LTKPYQLAPRRYGYHFFAAPRAPPHFSSADSVNSFLNRAFSVSNSFNRLASDTDIPPNFDFHK
jgi:hypothetical protein